MWSKYRKTTLLRITSSLNDCTCPESSHMFPSHHPATCINRHINATFNRNCNFENPERCQTERGYETRHLVNRTCHSILFKRLQLSYGLHGHALNWVISYLEGRSQYIKSGDSCSDQIPVTDCVPQGSVLGPLLGPFTSLHFTCS